MTESAFHRRTLTTKGTPMELDKRLEALEQKLAEQEEKLLFANADLLAMRAAMVTFVPFISTSSAAHTPPEVPGQFRGRPLA